jgi:pimeloyl-ACP methyl ester carboxylesterase
MWELAPEFGARIVFAEHRYEGESLPPKDLSEACLSYASTMQALADYARLLEEELNPNNVAPVIVFGGSYGGMLSAWMVSLHDVLFLESNCRVTTFEMSWIQNAVSHECVIFCRDVILLFVYC